MKSGASGAICGAMVFSICGGTSIDMVARARWSCSRSVKKASLRPAPMTWRSCRAFFTQWARCHCADSQSAVVTPDQPGKRRQSGSYSSRRWYTYGWSITRPPAHGSEDKISILWAL